MNDTDSTIDKLNNLYLLDDINCSITKRIENQRLNLINIINNSFLKETVDLSKINDAYNAANKCIEEYLKGHTANAIKEIDIFFKSENNSKLYLKNVPFSNPGDLSAFRMRSSDFYELYSKEEMMHIPEGKRFRVGNQRFSVSGFPCLYLGSSIYCCWEELNRPDIEKFNVVKIQNKRLLKCIDLTLPYFDRENIKDCNNIYKIILPLLCSLKVQHKDGVFKEEYIIPQAFLSLMITYRKRSNTEMYDLMGLHAIKYTSTIYNTNKDMFKQKELMTNYVIPILGEEFKNGLCKYIVENYEITEVTSPTNERVRTPFYKPINKKETEVNTLYNNTEFGILEDRLKLSSFNTLV